MVRLTRLSGNPPRKEGVGAGFCPAGSYLNTDKVAGLIYSPVFPGNEAYNCSKTHTPPYTSPAEN